MNKWQPDPVPQYPKEIEKIQSELFLADIDIQDSLARKAGLKAKLLFLQRAKLCAVCGIPFNSVRRTASLCSTNCRLKNMRNLKPRV